MYTHINDVEHTHTPHAFVVVNMAIDLSTNRDSLLEAYKDVANDKTNTNWALFGYVGTSDVLKVVERGSDGIEELVDEVNSSKVQYAYCRVKDPNTDLPKYVLINWVRTFLSLENYSSVYQKTYAKKDINTKKRDEFWAKTEEEEKKRQQEDRDRLVKEKDKLEQDRKKREVCVFGCFTPIR
ncbi:drebrin-like protein [Octopus bimaculoides]|uniref:drebrin-like protein n=1 Tax=Octopus bimaculoides TaxID=37653 RepID=UPI0022E48345|nr:drebrin-like protein [Octopus bimaculoides]